MPGRRGRSTATRYRGTANVGVLPATIARTVAVRPVVAVGTGSGNARVSVIAGAADIPTVTPSVTNVTTLRYATIDDVAEFRGYNWYGVEDNKRFPTLAELQNMAARGYTIVRLPIRADTATSAIETFLDNCDTAKIWAYVEEHTYGYFNGDPRINNPGPNGILLTAANAQQWYDKCVTHLNLFGHHPSYIPGDMNEPEQNGAAWEPVSAGRVTALVNAGWTGIIGVSAAARSSAGAINNHHNDWWVSHPNAFLEVHHYLNGQTDSHTQTTVEMDAWVVSSSGQGDLTTWNQYINRAFGWGCFGTAVWNNVPIMIGEYAQAVGMDTALETYLDKVDTRGVGAVFWAGGMWQPTNTNYAWDIERSTSMKDIMTAHSFGPIT